MTSYRGVEGTRPYAGVAWYYAEYRQRVSATFIDRLAERLGWTRTDRILDLGAGPGQLSVLAAPYVAEVVAVDLEPDMVAEGIKRAEGAGLNNVTFVVASSDDLSRLAGTLGRFRSALMGMSFHWMLEKDRVLRDLSGLIDDSAGSIAFVTPYRVGASPELEAAELTVHGILERYLADVPPGPHPRGRHDRFEEILARSPFPHVETLEHVYRAVLRPTVASIIGVEYTISHVLTRLGERRAVFEREVTAALGSQELGAVEVTLRNEALIGTR